MFFAEMLQLRSFFLVIRSRMATANQAAKVLNDLSHLFCKEDKLAEKGTDRLLPQ